MGTVAMPRNGRRGVHWSSVSTGIWVPIGSADGTAVAVPSEDGDNESDATLPSATTVFADSVDSDDEEDAAVADGPNAPRRQKDTRPIDTTTTQWHVPAWAAQRNEQEHVGNVGWLFGNWGKRPNKP